MFQGLPLVFRPKRSVRIGLLLGVAILCNLLDAHTPASFAQTNSSEGLLITQETAPAYRKLPDIENQLYGHAYPNQAISMRIRRIERTLFGGAQGGAIETRMRRIESSVVEQKSKEHLASQEPMLTYLENKLFQRTFESRPLPERVRQLEVQVFGHTFENYPTSVRLKKLTYAMPIMAKEIRLSKNDGAVIASTARVSARNSRGGPPSIDKVQLDASSPHALLHSKATTPSASSPLSNGNYIQAIHRNPDGTTLRWKSLPIRVFIKPGSGQNKITNQALQAWRQSFQVETVSDSTNADVVVSWDPADWAQNTTGLLTRPVARMSPQNSLRTVIFINMAPLQNEPMLAQLHVMSHQLGHAFGLWGHSHNPEDLMYPLFKEETNDFPSRLAWRSIPRNDRFEAVLAEDFQPSQRDINTLMKIYDLPATDLSAYKP